MKYLGIDLGWTTGGTGLALLNSAGNLVASGRVQTDTEIDAWIDNLAGRPLVVGVDAPLVVPNETGARAGEREVAQAFGAYGASPYSSSRARLGPGPTRAMRLAQRRGWRVDPASRIEIGATVCLEVYPHPALVALFELPYRLLYKKGTRAQRRAGQEQLVSLLESIPELRLSESARWPEIRRIIEDPTPGELERLEDELDAIVCAHIAWLWHHRPDSLHVYGSLAEGYIVAPTPPTHPAVHPSKEEADVLRSEVFVEGRLPRPEHAEPWKQAVQREVAAAEPVVDDDLELELDFWLAPDQRGVDEPLLEELVAVGLDALSGVLGRGVGSTRIGRVTASRHWIRSEEELPGVRVRVGPAPRTRQA